MDDKHSPGPWTNVGNHTVQGDHEGHRYDIAHMRPLPVRLDVKGSVLANAILMAAAPDLLTACHVADLAMTNANPEHCGGSIGHAKMVVRDAIDLATGAKAKPAEPESDTTQSTNQA